MLVFIVKQENAGYNDHHTGELTHCSRLFSCKAAYSM